MAIPASTSNAKHKVDGKTTRPVLSLGGKRKLIRGAKESCDPRRGYYRFFGSGCLRNVVEDRSDRAHHGQRCETQGTGGGRVPSGGHFAHKHTNIRSASPEVSWGPCFVT